MRVVQHRIEVDVLDLGHGGNITWHGHVDLGIRFALYAKQMVDLERLATVIDQQLAVAADRALPHAEDAELAHERIVDDLEHVGDHMAGRVGIDHQRFAIAANKRRWIPLGRIRQQSSRQLQ